MKYFHQMLSIIRSSHIEILSFIRAMMAIASAGRGAYKEADGDEVLVVRRPLRVLKFCSCTSSISMIIFGVSNSRQPFRTACDKARRSTSPPTATVSFSTRDMAAEMGVFLKFKSFRCVRRGSSARV